VIDAKPRLPTSTRTLCGPAVRTRRWRVTRCGRWAMATSLYQRGQHFPETDATVAA